MAKKYEIPPKLKSAAKRLTPLLVVFVLIVGMLPALPVSASQTYGHYIYIDGELAFSIMSTDGAEDVQITCKANSVECYLADLNSTRTYAISGSDFLGLHIFEDATTPLIPLDTPTIYSGVKGDNKYTYFYTVRGSGGSSGSGGTEVQTYSVGIYVDGVSIYESAATADQCPVLLITVFDNGFYVYDEAGTSLLATYTYSGSGTFCGIQHTEDATLEIGTGLKAPGSSVTVGGQSRNVSVELNSVVSSSSGGVTTPTCVYQRVTAARSDWSGTYLIVYENSTASGSVFTGVDASGNYISADIQNNTIYGTAALDACRVKIEKYGDGYSIQLLGGNNAGMFINASKSAINKTVFNTTAQMLTVSYDGSTVKILDGEKPFQFNKASNAQWFRFYGSQPGGQQEIALYRLDDGEDAPVLLPPEVSIDSNGILSITNSDSFVTQYRIYLDETLMATIAKSGTTTTFDLKTLGLPSGEKYYFTCTSGNAAGDFSILGTAADKPLFAVWNLTGKFFYIFTGSVYDGSGNTLFGSYAFSGESPSYLTLTVTSNNITIQYGSLSESWSASDGFLGVYDSNGVFYGVGTHTIYADSATNSLSLDFYTAFDNSSTDYSDYSGFGSFIVDVLGGFLGFSILPGLTLGGLLAVFVVLGIVKLFFSK